MSQEPGQSLEAFGFFLIVEIGGRKKKNLREFRTDALLQGEGSEGSGKTHPLRSLHLTGQTFFFKARD